MIKAEAKHILLKLRDEGMICQQSKITDGTPHTERLEALNQSLLMCQAQAIVF